MSVPATALAEPAAVFRREELRPSQPKSKGMMVGAIVVVAALVGAYFVFGRKSTATLAPDTTGTAALNNPPPAPDSARTAAAAAVAMGFIRISGDLPDDAIVWVDSARKTGRVLPMAPGSYNIEIETAEFDPWERRITVRAGDTTRVRVELELKSDSTTSP